MYSYERLDEKITIKLSSETKKLFDELFQDFVKRYGDEIKRKKKKKKIVTKNDFLLFLLNLYIRETRRGAVRFV